MINKPAHDYKFADLTCSTCGRNPGKNMLRFKGALSFERSDETYGWLTKAPYEEHYFCQPQCLLDLIRGRSESEYDDWQAQ